MTNSSYYSGCVALVERGGCSFFEKARLAQDSDALGVIVGNNETDDNDRVAMRLDPVVLL